MEQIQKSKLFAGIGFTLIIVAGILYFVKISSVNMTENFPVLPKILSTVMWINIGLALGFLLLAFFLWTKSRRS
jgi:hypothetical protein